MQPQVLTEEQAALYDRQIRLWGVEAQQSLGQSNILMYGFTAVASEICKNLVLAGIKSIQINDTLKCTTEDQGAHLFLQGSVGQNRAVAGQAKARELNPHVDVRVSNLALSDIDFSKFHLCCFSGVSPRELIEANNRARKAGTLFFVAETCGLFGFTFQDLLQDYSFTQKDDKTQQTERKTTQFVSLENAFSAKWTKETNPLYAALKCTQLFWSEHNRAPLTQDFEQLSKIKALLHNQYGFPGCTDDLLKTFIQHKGFELSPVCAVVGGEAANEIVKILCHNDAPFNNFFFFNWDGQQGAQVACMKQ